MLGTNRIYFLKILIFIYFCAWGGPTLVIGANRNQDASANRDDWTREIPNSKSSREVLQNQEKPSFHFHWSIALSPIQEGSRHGLDWRDHWVFQIHQNQEGSISGRQFWYVNSIFNILFTFCCSWNEQSAGKYSFDFSWWFKLMGYWTVLLCMIQELRVIFRHW